MENEQQKEMNVIDMESVKRCFPERATLTIQKPRQPRTSSTYSIRMFCDPSMKENETKYCMESVKQILPILEFYSDEQGRDITIYWRYNKNIPLEFVNI